MERFFFLNLYELEFKSLTHMKRAPLKRLLWISLSLNVLLVLGGGIHFFKNRIQTNHEENELPYWYFKNSTYWQERSLLFKSLPNEDNEILFVGDSQINGCEWIELLGSSKIKNRGIDGDNTEGVLERLSEITSSKPAKIFLEVGTNDLALKRSISVIGSDYSAILFQIKRDSPKTKIFVQSILPRHDNPYRKGGVENDSILKLNKALKVLALREGVTYVDLHRFFVDGRGYLQKRYSMDGVHLNAKGYAVWKEQVKSFVQKSIF